MKNYILPKDKKGKKKNPDAPTRPPSASFLFCPEHHPKITSQQPKAFHWGHCKNVGEMCLNGGPKVTAREQSS
jgi:high mobility group protein B2